MAKAELEEEGMRRKLVEARGVSVSSLLLHLLRALKGCWPRGVRRVVCQRTRFSCPWKRD
jgi:hypothetical protein